MKNIIAICFLIFACSSQAQDLDKKYKGLPCLNKTFQIHAHVVLDSLGIANYTAEALEQSLVGTNEMFSPICVNFELCSVDTITNYEFDSIGQFVESDEMQKLFHLENRINVYLVTELPSPGICGFATLNGISMMNNGMVFLKCIGSGTLTHEMGHMFGLQHTFTGSGIELVNGDNCETEGDMICDTPADPFVEGDDMSLYIGDDCEFISIKLDSNFQYYQPDVGNIMSYYPCACGFTRGQYLHMAEVFLNSDPKMW